MKRWVALLGACLVAGLVPAGCGSDESDGAGKVAVGGGDLAVRMKDTRFVPMDVTVKAGHMIEWTNDDPFAHTVTKASGPGPEFDSGTMNGGGTFKQRFDKPGTIDYVCRIHPDQTGTITVE